MTAAPAPEVRLPFFCVARVCYGVGGGEGGVTYVRLADTRGFFVLSFSYVM